MLTLYYCPFACSMASHVALEEAGASFEAKKINIFTGEHLKPEYLAINPRAKVPALRFDDGQVLLESTAILDWVGTAYPDRNLLGGDALERAQTIAMCAWLSGTVHPAFSQFVHPERVTAELDGHAAVKAHAKESFWSYLQEIDAMLADRPWIMGKQFTVADPYALVFYPWGRESGLPIGDLTNFAAMKDRLIERPAARKALEREKSVLLSM
jgi:glutathione S-transferase